MTASLKRVDSRNFAVPIIHIGVLPGGADNANEIAASLGRIAPDRFEITLLGGDDANANATHNIKSWPAVDVLIVLCSSSFSQRRGERIHYIQRRGERIHCFC